MIIKSKISKRLRNTGFFLVIFGLSFLLFSVAKAQGLDTGINVIDNSLKLSATDPRIVAARIIQIFLSLLGAIAVVLIIYAGVLWMLSEGNEDKIDKAKKILKQTIIGLIIILSSWSITTFILNKLIDQTQGGSPEPASVRNNRIDSGLAALGSCTLEGVYPAPNQTEVPRNTSILVTFKEAVDPATICTAPSDGTCSNSPIIKDNIKIAKTVTGTSTPEYIDATVTLTPDKKVLVIIPSAYLGSSISNTDYVARLQNIKKTDGQLMFATCASDSFQWNFTVNNKLDLTPPQVLSVFPAPDNSRDLVATSSAVSAQALVQLKVQPQKYQAASVNSVTPGDNSPQAAVQIDNYHGQDSSFRVNVVSAGAGLKGQLFIDQVMLGNADFNGRQLSLPGYLTLSVQTDPAPGQAWNINISPEKVATTITIGSTVYVFADNANGNNLPVGSTLAETKDNFLNKINGLEAAEVSVASVSGPDYTLTLTSRIAGASGNNIVIDTNDTDRIVIPQERHLYGGQDGGNSVAIKDKKDQPRNSVIQINFDEAINPIMISGTADQLKDYVQVFNHNKDGAVAGSPCSANNDCRSFKCESELCVGDFLSGKFVPSSNYKTVEFISDNECGVNGCGEKIYCLPPDSSISVLINAADLFKCSSDSDCSPFGGHYSCINTANLGYNSCYAPKEKNYPLARLDISERKGLTDLANNSLDGNGDGFADGKNIGSFSYYILNIGKANHQEWKDGLRWVFFISDKIMLGAPKLTAASPVLNSPGVGVSDQVKLSFDTLLMASTIRTGGETTTVNLGDTSKTVTHKFLNLWSQTPQPLGFWTESDNRDAAVGGLPLDGYPDVTDAYIRHSEFGESVSYNVQAGSGLKDIYQNCFKPSAGVSCNAGETDPSCCFGQATSSTSGLDSSGNCK